MTMAPAVVFLPNSVPCGPRRTVDLVDVGKVEGGGGGAAVVDAIDIEADAGFEAVIGLADGDDAAAEAADGEAGVAGVGRAVVERGDEQGELPGVDRVAGVEKVAGDGGERDGDALGGFVAQAGGDDDLGQAIRRGRFGSGEGEEEQHPALYADAYNAN